MSTSKDMLVSTPNLSERIGDAAYHLEQTKEGPALLMLDSWDAQATNMEAELSRLRSERDEALGALRRMRKPFKSIDKKWALDWGPVNGACHHADKVLSKHSKEVTG